MNKIRYILVILGLFGFAVNSQTVNQISENDFKQIKFNGIDLVELIDTEGDSPEVSNLVGNQVEYETSGVAIKEKTVVFQLNDLSFKFIGLSSNQEPQLASLSCSSAVIKGYYFELGNDLPNENDLELNTKSDDSKSVIFRKTGTDYPLIIVDLDNDLKVKTIKYIDI